MPIYKYGLEMFRNFFKLLLLVTILFHTIGLNCTTLNHY